MPGVRASHVDTDRIRMHVLEAGPDDGVPVVLVHGNLSTGRFYEHLMTRFGDRYRVIAPDMRSFGQSDPAPLDATRGLSDWADDIDALLRALGVSAPPHLVGWSTAGAAIVRYAAAHRAASLTFLDPVSPYGYGAVHRDGRPAFDDFAGSGAGGANPEFVRRLAEGDDSDESPFSPRTVMRTTYWSADFRLPRDREDVLVAEILRTVIGDDGYPGDGAESSNWPGFGPGTRGILNALSPKYCRWDDVVDLDPKPPVLWTHGTNDLVVADGSMLEFGTLGQAGLVPGWPGDDLFPPQPMITQIRDVLERYAAAGGLVRTEMFDGSGHGPHVDADVRWLAVYLDFLAGAS
ncbi:alpha/beta fold hydrolase [Pseudonocardia endophytica]|nr:alpha/beta hydrolase [Pseudonocardia endophytica]